MVQTSKLMDQLGIKASLAGKETLVLIVQATMHPRYNFAKK